MFNTSQLIPSGLTRASVRGSAGCCAAGSSRKLDLGCQQGRGAVQEILSRACFQTSLDVEYRQQAKTNRHVPCCTPSLLSQASGQEGCGSTGLAGCPWVGLGMQRCIARSTGSPLGRFHAVTDCTTPDTGLLVTAPPDRSHRLRSRVFTPDPRDEAVL